MYISIENLTIFVIFPMLGLIAYIFALRYQLKETEKELWKERDKNYSTKKMKRIL